jgi:flavin reductase (DIM6/NTAB) family NADH-FMN oxidoreductase RutF
LEDLRQALRRLAKAVVIITCRHEGQRYAMAATAVSELSLDPPSLLICVNQTASLHPPLAAGAPFAINILHHGQENIASRCSGPIKGEERFNEGTWSEGTLAVPCLAGAQASIVCRNVDRLAHGTHTVFIGDVEQVLLDGIPDPLIYIDGRYTRAMAGE